MKSPLTSLLWKEWREHRWKLAAICVINIVVPFLMALRAPENFFGAAVATLMFSVPLSSMFLGMGVAAGEQSRGTIRFLQAMPTSMRKVAAVRLVVAAVTVIVPIAVTLGFAFTWEGLFVAPPFSENQPIFSELAGSIWAIEGVPLAVMTAGAIAGLSFLVWMAAAGVNLSDEIRAGAVGMLTIAAAWTIVGFAQVYVGPTAPVHRGNLVESAPPRWFRVATAAAPGGAAVVRERYADSPPGWMPAHWPYLAIGLATNGALAAWFVARFGRIAVGTRRTAPMATRSTPPAWLGPPRRSAAAAILWKQCRESLPIAAMGAAVIFCLCVVVLLAQRQYGDRNVAVSETLSMSLVGSMIVGLFVSVVAGLGILLDDLRAGLHTFWRSRPIDVDRWFAIKFFAGLFITVGMLSLPPLAMCAYLAISHGEELRLSSYIPQIGTLLLIQAGMYCAAVTAMALVRQPIYAAILAFGALAATTVAANWLAYHVNNAETFVIPAMVGGLTVAASIIAWLAVRNNWGWEV